MLNRAYSLLTVKAVDTERRVITGIATTPTPDRLGDVVEPKGASFRNPLPLLLYHDTQRPVGTVRFKKPTDDGIEFEASLPDIDEPGPLRDRISEAWLSLKNGLIRGVSIGFRVLDDGIELLRSGGVRFTRVEVLELSLVVVPANSEATIHTIKSIDAPHLAASGTGAEHVSKSSPGVSGSRAVKALQDRTSMKTHQEQITAWEATRTTKMQRMSALMTVAADAGETLDAAQTEEYDGLEAEVKQIGAHLTRLVDLDKINKAAAVPARGDTPETAAAARAGASVISVRSQTPPGIAFSRYAMCLMASRGNLSSALEIAKARYPDETRIINTLKSAVAGGTTTDATWAGSLVDYQNLTSDFIEYLRPQTIIGKFGQGGIPSLTNVPFNVKIQGQTSGGTGYWVGQGAPKPVTKFDFAATTLTWAKVAAISVITEELARFSSPAAEGLVRKALSEALIERIDIDFIDPAKAAVANISPASITNGITPIASTGTDPADIRHDVTALFAPFIAANITPINGVFIMSATTALALSLMENALGQKTYPDITMMGGRFAGLPVIVSQYISDGSPTGSIVVLVNASDIYLSDDGQVVIDASREASLQMDNAPTNSAATGTGASMVSMFQTDSIALRAERFINWARRRAAAVSFLDNVQWTSAGSPA